jgi:hypothetical protein
VPQEYFCNFAGVHDVDLSSNLFEWHVGQQVLYGPDGNAQYGIPGNHDRIQGLRTILHSLFPQDDFQHVEYIPRGRPHNQLQERSLSYLLHIPLLGVLDTTHRPRRLCLVDQHTRLQLQQKGANVP